MHASYASPGHSGCTHSACKTVANSGNASQSLSELCCQISRSGSASGRFLNVDSECILSTGQGSTAKHCSRTCHNITTSFSYLQHTPLISQHIITAQIQPTTHTSTQHIQRRNTYNDTAHTSTEHAQVQHTRIKNTQAYNTHKHTTHTSI